MTARKKENKALRKAKLIFIVSFMKKNEGDKN